MSPAYIEVDDATWEQAYLARVLQAMKDSEIPKLKFLPQGNKPLEYEKWVLSWNTTMQGLHPEIGIYWSRVCTSAEKSYGQYLKDLSYTRVSIKPTDVLARTSIEMRIESRLKMLLNNTIPENIIRQCDDTEQVTCAQILYRTMVFADPANKDDYIKMVEILTKPKAVELNKLYERMIQFKFARTRLKNMASENQNQVSYLRF